MNLFSQRVRISSTVSVNLPGFEVLCYLVEATITVEPTPRNEERYPDSCPINYVTFLYFRKVHTHALLSEGPKPLLCFKHVSFFVVFLASSPYSQGEVREKIKPDTLRITETDLIPVPTHRASKPFICCWKLTFKPTFKTLVHRLIDNQIIYFVFCSMNNTNQALNIMFHIWEFYIINIPSWRIHIEVAFCFKLFKHIVIWEHMCEMSLSNSPLRN